jgi:hypothetical protein
MVLGILGIGLPALIFGIVALKKKCAGKGMAVAGIVLGSVWTVVLILVLSSIAFLVTARKGAVATSRPFTTNDVSKYQSRVDKRLERLASDAADLRAQYATQSPEVFAKFDATMEKTRAAMQEMQTLTDENALKAKRDEIEGYRFDMQKLLNSLKKK